MLWLVGTGRCGFHNFTKWVNGYIETDPGLRQIAVQRHHDEDFDMQYVFNKYKERVAMHAFSIADCSQFAFIDIIRAVDPSPHFIWLIRNKQECIDSFMEKGSENERIHPKGWKFEYETKRELLNWYYDRVNMTIEQNLVGAKYAIIKTHEMPRFVP